MRERLRAEFDEVDDGSIPVIFFRKGNQWLCSIGSPPEAQNLKGIQLHGRRFRVQKRVDGEMLSALRSVYRGRFRISVSSLVTPKSSSSSCMVVRLFLTLLSSLFVRLTLVCFSLKAKLDKTWYPRPEQT
jgi:hypothetical protein